MQVFNARLAKIEDYCDPVTNRVKEMKARPAAIACKSVFLTTVRGGGRGDTLLSYFDHSTLIFRSIQLTVPFDSVPFCPSPEMHGKLMLYCITPDARNLWMVKLFYLNRDTVRVFSTGIKLKMVVVELRHEEVLESSRRF